MLKIEQMENNLYSIQLEIHGIKFCGIFEKVEVDEKELRPMENGLLILIKSEE